MIGIVVIISFVAGCLAKQESKTLQIPALGRSFALGDLYNIKDDQVILGPKLWSHEHLSDYANRIQRRTDFEILASEDISENKNHFDISASLSLSFACGLIKVSGSAAFLNDRVKTSNMARVSLKYDSRTFARELKPNLFTKVDYPEVLEKAPGATHVVTGIAYGVGAIFVFEQMVRQNEEKKHVEGSMQIAVKSLPGIEIEGSGKVKLTEEQRQNTKRFSCKFHGDLVLDEHPGNYEEAVKVYKRLPEMLGENFENSVPMGIWLYPLDALPISAESTLVHNIRNSLVQEVSKKMEELAQVERWCNDILFSDMATYHERVRHNVVAFQSNIHVFLLLFKQDLAKLLPEIRENGNENLLAQLLAERESSTFSQANLNQWMDEARQEAVVLTSTQRLPNYCKDYGDFVSRLLNGVRYTLSLVMRLEKGEDEFLNEMKKYLDEHKSISYKLGESQPYVGRDNKWWRSNKLVADLQQKGESFTLFSQLEDKRKKEGFKSNIQFLTIEKKVKEGEEPFDPSVTLQLYDHALLIDPDFQIPSEPGVPVEIQSSYNSLTLEWNQPRLGDKNVKFYEVETYTKTTSKNESKFELIKTSKIVKGSMQQIAVEGGQVAQISGLKPEGLYYFVVYAISVLGRTSVSKESSLIPTETCPKGMYYSNEECKPCLPMFYSDVSGARSCLKCAPGTISKTGSAACTKCPKGTHANGRCVPCDPGYFSEISGADLCRKCPLGTYSDIFGGESCKMCPKGTTTVISGSKYIDDCGKDLNGKIKSTIDEFTKHMSSQLTANSHDILSMDAKMGRMSSQLSANSHDILSINNFISSVRLIDHAGRANTVEGRLEVFRHGHWGTVCDDNKSGSGKQENNHMAWVVCRMLGTSGGPFKDKVFTQGEHSYTGGTGPIMLDDVDCSGGENSIWACSHNLYEFNCGHREDVAIQCYHVGGETM